MPITHYLLPALSLWVIHSDIHTRQISNKLILAVAVTVLLISKFSAIAVLPLILAFLVGLTLFALGIFAGGDIKLMLAFLPGIALQWWPVVLLSTAILGGILALAYLLYGLLKNQLKEVRKKGIPYGIPITLSGLLGILLTNT